MVTFNKENHTYFNPLTQRYYMSVSKVLSNYKEPFDKEFFAAKKARQEGITKEEMIARWDKNNKDACDKGQTIHNIVEQYLKDGEVIDEALIAEFKKIFNKADYKRVLSEEIVYSDMHEIAGTSDLICDVDNDLFDVYDFKTNKNFLFYNKFGKYLKSPLNNLQQCQYNDYSLQLSFYAYMYGMITNKKVRKISILYYDGKQFYNYPTPYMYWEISALLKHFLMNKK